MKTSFRTSLSVLLLIFAFKFVSAQDQPAKAPQALLDMMKFEGSWQGPATMVLDGKTYSFTYYANFKKTADGSGLIMDEWFTHPELGALKGANLIGYNVNDGNIHWFSVDNFGTTHDHIGKWISPDHFSMQAAEMQKDKKMIEKIDMVFKNNDEMEFSIVASLDDVVFEKGNATFKRTHK